MSSSFSAIQETIRSFHTAPHADQDRFSITTDANSATAVAAGITTYKSVLMKGIAAARTTPNKTVKNIIHDIDYHDDNATTTTITTDGDDGGDFSSIGAGTAGDSCTTTSSAGARFLNHYSVLADKWNDDADDDDDDDADEEHHSMAIDHPKEKGMACTSSSTTTRQSSPAVARNLYIELAKTKVIAIKDTTAEDDFSVFEDFKGVKVNTNMNNKVKCFNHEEDDTSTIVKLPKLILKHILKKNQLSFKFQRRKKHTLISHNVRGTNVSLVLTNARTSPSRGRRMPFLMKRLLPLIFALSCGGHIVSAATATLDSNDEVAPMKIHEWTLLDVTDHTIGAIQNGDDMSIENLQSTLDLAASLESLALLHERDIETLSQEDQVNRIKDISASISALEVFLTEFKIDVESLPKDIYNLLSGSMKQLRSSLLRASIAMDDVAGIVERSSVGPPTEEDDTRKMTSTTHTGTITSTERALYTINNATTQVSSGEYEMRARGYHGFMAEDQKIDPVLHAPGGGGAKMYDRIGEDFVGMGFQVPNSFQSSSFHTTSGSLHHGQRRLNDQGACAVPNENDLKVERCNRLLSCAREFSLYDLFVYYFGDNADDNTGEINADSVHYADEKDILTKYAQIQSSLSNGDCDSLLRLFHRYDEAKEKFVPGSVTSICRSWGTTKNISLKSIYDFFRYRFMIYDATEKTWKEPKGPTHEVALGSNAVTAWKIGPKNMTETSYQILIVGKSGDMQGKGAGIGVKDTGSRNGNTFYLIGCSKGDISINGRTAGCVYSLDTKGNGFDDGRFDFTLESESGSLVYAIYDYRALKIVGKMYEELIGCAESIKNKFSVHDVFPFEFPFAPFSGMNPECFDAHGKFDYAGCPNDSIYNFTGSKGYYNPTANGKLSRYYHYFTSFDAYFATTKAQNTIDIADVGYNDAFYMTPLFVNFTDIMSTLMFGNETTIGQICSYAKAWNNYFVNTLPGYCCLDAPYEANLWGETYSCYEEYGANKGQLRSPNDCKHKASFLASFNEAACNPFGGTWCPLSRRCDSLLNCVTQEKIDAENDPTKKAFFAYLDDAPKLTDPSSTVQCGNMREYLEFDRDYPDDSRICEELKAIQCRNEFTNLSEATGSGDDGSEELTVVEKFQSRSLAFYDKSSAQEFRLAIKVVSAGATIAKQVKDSVDSSTLHACLGFISAIAGTATPCAFAMTTIKIIVLVAYIILKAAEMVMKSLHSVMVERPDIYAARELQEVNYANIITVGRNGISTFKAVQQVKALLGNFADDYYDSVAEDSNGRRLLDSCAAGDECMQGHCDCPSEADMTRLCNCSPNWDYIKVQREAGCDLRDSDGDKIEDNCEDRFPPGLIFPNNFQCDKTMPKKLCYDEFTFPTYELAENFLRDGMKIIDDCAISSDLSFVISRIDGTSCSSTVFEITPYQDYSNQNWFVNCSEANFTNPLYGATKNVTMRVDDSDPVVSCGFHDVHIDTPYIEIDDKVLYHRIPSGSDFFSLAKSLFWYNVTDNCEDSDMTVITEVKTNELQFQGEIAKIIKYQHSGYVEQAEVLYSPTTCDIRNDTHDACSRDYHVLPYFRFYEILVTAKDAASRIANDTCHIVIIPECDDITDASEYASECDLIGGKWYYKKDILAKQIQNSVYRYKIQTMDSLLWNFSKIYDFSDLHTNTYSPSTAPSSMPSSNPSGEPSSMPSFIPSKNPSNEPSSEPSNQPSSMPSLKPSPAPTDQPSSMPSDLPTFFPVVKCGFRRTNDVDVVEGKTLYFYPDFGGRKGELIDSQFFFEVMDKGTDINSYNDITVQVTSNELETNKDQMSSLVLKSTTDPTGQVQFNFLANDCGGGAISSKSSCTIDPSIDRPIRFYEIRVKTVDPYGRSHTDTCHVVMVQKCNANTDSNCVDFAEQYYARTSSGRLLKKKKLPKGDYFTLEYLKGLVKSSTTRINLASLKSKWTFV